jgi:hypothetical protein
MMLIVKTNSILAFFLKYSTFLIVFFYPRRSDKKKFYFEKRLRENGAVSIKNFDNFSTIFSLLWPS